MAKISMPAGALNDIVLQTARQLPGCEAVEKISIQRELPRSKGRPNWDVVKIEPLPSDDAVIRMCRVINELREKFEAVFP